MPAILTSIALVVALLCANPLSAEPSTEALLKARIVQLEAQLADASRRLNLLAAQLSEVQQPAIARVQQEQRATAEKEAGCSIDWSVVPPVCKPPSPTVAKP